MPDPITATGMLRPPTGEVLRQHVERVGHHDRHTRHPALLDRFRDRGGDLEVRLQHVETRLAGLRVVPDRADEDVFLGDRIEPTAAQLGAREQRQGMEEVERFTARTLPPNGCRA